MTKEIDRMINDAFRTLHKKIRLFARRHASDELEIDDLTSEACEKAFRYFSRLTENVELDSTNLPRFIKKAEQRAGVALMGTRIDHYRKRRVEQQFFESASPEIMADTWLGGAYHAPAPDQRIRVAQQMSRVLKNSTSPGQRHLAEALQRHVDRGDYGISPAELAREANESANCRHGWARKLRAKGVD